MSANPLLLQLPKFVTLRPEILQFRETQWISFIISVPANAQYPGGIRETVIHFLNKNVLNKVTQFGLIVYLDFDRLQINSAEADYIAFDGSIRLTVFIPAIYYLDTETLLIADTKVKNKDVTAGLVLETRSENGAIHIIGDILPQYIHRETFENIKIGDSIPVITRGIEMTLGTGNVTFSGVAFGSHILPPQMRRSSFISLAEIKDHRVSPKKDTHTEESLTKFAGLVAAVNQFKEFTKDSLKYDPETKIDSLRDDLNSIVNEFGIQTSTPYMLGSGKEPTNPDLIAAEISRGNILGLLGVIKTGAAILYGSLEKPDELQGTAALMRIMFREIDIYRPASTPYTSPRVFVVLRGFTGDITGAESLMGKENGLSFNFDPIIDFDSVQLKSYIKYHQNFRRMLYEHTYSLLLDGRY